MERIPSVPSAENSSIAKHRKKTNAVSRPGLLFVGIFASLPDLPPGTVSTSFSGEYRTLYGLVRANESNGLEKRKHRMEFNKKDGGCIWFPLPFGVVFGMAHTSLFLCFTFALETTIQTGVSDSSSVVTVAGGVV